MSDINDLIRFTYRKRRTFRVFATTSRITILMTKRVGFRIYSVEREFPIVKLLEIKHWRKFLADELFSMRAALRIEVARDIQPFITAPSYFIAQEYARRVLKLPNSCWRYASDLHRLQGLKRGTTIIVINNGCKNFEGELLAFCAARQYNVKQVSF